MCTKIDYFLTIYFGETVLLKSLYLGLPFSWFHWPFLGIISVSALELAMMNKWMKQTNKKLCSQNLSLLSFFSDNKSGEERKHCSFIFFHFLSVLLGHII